MATENEFSHVERILAEEEDWFALLLRYGLFLGAIFQLGCIAACIFLSDTDGQISSPEVRDGKIDDKATQNNGKRQHHRTRKQDKKKRR